MSERTALLEMLPKNSIGVEIGVAHGNFSQKILDVVKPRRLYLVDPWCYDEEVQKFNKFYGGKADGQSFMDDMYHSVTKRFSQHRNVEIRRQCSDRFLVETSDQFFDWVYVDGDHDFGPCLTDILLSIDKVKVGGFICGDDYDWGKQHNYPVQRAVDVVAKNENRLARANINGRAVHNGQWIFRRVK